MHAYTYHIQRPTHLERGPRCLQCQRRTVPERHKIEYDTKMTSGPLSPVCMYVCMYIYTYVVGYDTKMARGSLSPVCMYVCICIHTYVVGYDTNMARGFLSSVCMYLCMHIYTHMLLSMIQKRSVVPCYMYVFVLCEYSVCV
jgi:hypothetical protein